MSEIIIVGAGAAGLNAARILSAAGRQVSVIEARNRIGGRIFSSAEKAFTTIIENGAEFIHGDLPLTQQLAKEANVELREGGGRSWNVNGGAKDEGELFDNDWGKMIAELEKLEHDMSIGEFLNQKFGDRKYQTMRESVTAFVQGFDAADTMKASALALREEWTNSDAMKGYQLVGGYSQLMDFLFKKCQAQGVTFHFSIAVKTIHWGEGNVAVTTDNGEQFHASKILITIPPAVLKSGAIQFEPEIPTQMNALQKIETGGVIKFLIEFDEAHWENDDSDDFRQFPDAHFIFSDAYIPTWWSQRPSPVPLLTGWLAGPPAMAAKSNENLLNEGIRSLAYIFDCKEESLRSKIIATKVINWINDPFSLGAYAYKTVDTSEAIKVLSEPVKNTIFFAGEAYYDGPEMGTVEAALGSGKVAAAKI